MAFSRSCKGRVEIIHFYAMFRNINQTINIVIDFKIISMYTCSSQVLLDSDSDSDKFIRFSTSYKETTKQQQKNKKCRKPGDFYIDFRSLA